MSEKRVSLTVLNGLAGRDVETSFDTCKAWGLRHLDLKDSLFGKRVEALTTEEAERVKRAADRRGLMIHTLSTCLFKGDIEQGKNAFRDCDVEALKNVLVVAKILAPFQIRLLMASSSRRPEILDSSVYLAERHPWVIGVYREAVDRIRQAGYTAVIENEAHNCLFATPAEIVSFFSAFHTAEAPGLIWDVQNLWQMGTFPTLAVYEILRPFVCMVHLKGGRSETAGGALKWKSHLGDASWPALPILRLVIEHGRSPVVCLNPPHGLAPVGFEHDPKRDIDFLRNSLREII